MIPIGYLYKKISDRPDWMLAEHVVDIYSVSSCISPSFLDYTSFWRHNGYWLFNSPEVMESLASQNRIDLASMVLFYFEAYENEFNEYDSLWSPIYPIDS